MIKEYKIDLSVTEDNEIKELGNKIADDNVVLFRDQILKESELVKICKLIGKVQQTKAGFSKPSHPFTHPVYPELIRVTNQREAGEKIGMFADKELDWHHNGPARSNHVESCVALYCIKPGINSVTSFCDVRQAYKDLPSDIKEICDDVDCHYKFENNTFYHIDENDAELVMFSDKRYYDKGAIKPLVYKHPFHEDKGLYFSHHFIRKMWRRSTDLFDEKELTNYLINHVFQEKYIAHHDDWKSGDLLFMDQFHSLHKRNAVEGDRFLYRICLDYSNVREKRLTWNERHSVT